MNPEENNPLANPGVPDFGISGGQVNIPGNDLAMSDSLSMAGDSLTAAGMAASTANSGPINFNQIDSVGSSNPAISPNEDPLVPAAPVPGSIGSVTSVPAAEPLANPFASTPTADNVNTAPSGAMPAPEVQPQPAPYNPFAQPASASPAPGTTPAPEPAKPFMTPAKDTVNPAFQPAPATTKKPKASHSMSPLTAILALVSALLLISTIVFAALFINAKNNPKVVYVPTASEGGESNTQIKFLTCSRNEEMNWLINDAYVVPAIRSLSLNYSGEQLGAISDEYQITFASDVDAIAGRDIFGATTAATLPVASDVAYDINGNILNVSVNPIEDPLTEQAAMTYLYGATEGVPSTSLSDAQSYFEANGFICTVE